MTSRSSHTCFLLYLQKMLLDANGESKRRPGNRKVHHGRNRGQLHGSSPVGREMWAGLPFFLRKLPRKSQGSGSVAGYLSFPLYCPSALYL